MGKIVIEVPEIPRGPNGPDGLLRLKWRGRRKYFKNWVLWIRAGVSFFPEVAAVVRCRVRIHQVRRQKLDPDNLSASCKPILDALQKLNFIHDDSEKWIDLDVTQEIGREKQTVITIEA